ncbi:hypothetical protein D9756_005159 [Leucocoprinus leucothites]|uniref:Methyltransferase domain-containing protein n=1 Tax=Leucocoprinus leucothites TaxID=201217 RepID=A0A8H5LKL8_9AGAR|nr:hypothetical protein D9756_005159 [Leucoagaricus leucothites]
MTIPKSVQEKVYFLPSNGEDERQRLEIQHDLILNSQGRKHIHAPINLETVSSVLETATGSGIWLKEVYQLVPDTAELIGVDISPNLFPPSPPPNVKYLQQSVLDLPKEWSNKFDLVHQRLLVLALRNDEWRTAINEMFRVLRPGGWLQLYEYDDWEKCGPVQQKMKDMVRLLMEAKGAHGIWPHGTTQWKEYMEETGFKDIRVTWHFWPTGRSAGEEGLRGKVNHLDFLKVSKKPIVGAGGFGIVSGEEEFDEWVEEVGRELDTRDGTRMRCVMICAQKPL